MQRFWKIRVVLALWARTLSVTPDGVPAPPKGELFEVAGEFLIAFDTLVIGLTACALSVKANGFASSPKGESQEHCRKLFH